jgi:hypothetical protein
MQDRRGERHVRGFEGRCRLHGVWGNTITAASAGVVCAIGEERFAGEERDFVVGPENQIAEAKGDIRLAAVAEADEAQFLQIKIRIVAGDDGVMGQNFGELFFAVHSSGNDGVVVHGGG